MDEQQFRQLALERGYGDFQTKAYVPHNAGPEGASVLLAKRMAAPSAAAA